MLKYQIIFDFSANKCLFISNDFKIERNVRQFCDGKTPEFRTVILWKEFESTSWG